MYCYHLSRILPCQGRASVCPNMPIMAYHGLTKCISRHRTQVFHLVTTYLHCYKPLIWLARPWSPQYLNQIADNWCRCEVTRRGSWLWGWIWSHEAPGPVPGRSWYSWVQHHIIRIRHLQKVEEETSRCFPPCSAWLTPGLCSPVCCAAHPAALQSLCRMLQRKWLLAGRQLFTFTMRAAVTGSGNVTVSKD